ncbi:DUF58 domain-containing protein [Aestuariibacter sp. AA17]|uniref:DUF58 domain-containing protein n=1 Tax=Fluctibacter corallii TaxID=2984329 RepID=A0ABT3A9P9_9ALTE|nr:DUF58 domain-containing protein [Aestuariibacter sp. AA17]MCV2885400.1 DUF58 domain-containing protein [Aestuariibacter sp. AA17]
MIDIPRWLAEHQATGISVSMPELIKYKDKTSLVDLRPKQPIKARLAGAYMAKTKGRGMEFDEARHYQPGDDIRAIDWRVTARTGKTHTKLYREEKERPVFILVDLTQSMYFGTQLLMKSVQACHLAALFAWSANKRGDRIGGVIFNSSGHVECKPLSRQKAVLGFLHRLTEFYDKHDTQINDAIALEEGLSRLRRLAHPGSLVYLISDFATHSERTHRHITQLSKHCEVIACTISDPFEHQLPESNVKQTVSITDGYVTKSLTLGDRNTAAQYQAQQEQKLSNLYSRFNQYQISHLPISAALPLEHQLKT